VKNNDFRLFFSLVSILFLFGCSYKLGSPNPPPPKVALNIINDSSLPRLGPFLVSELRKKFLLNGIDIYPSRSRDQNTAYLKVRVYDYLDSTEILSLRDTLLGTGQQLRVFAEMNLEDFSGIKKYNKKVSASSVVLRPSDVSSPIREPSLVSLAEELSNEIFFNFQQVTW